VRQTNGEKRNGGFHVVVCARERERTEIVIFRMWSAPDKWREQEYWVSVCSVRPTKGIEIVGFKLWCEQVKWKEREKI